MAVSGPVTALPDVLAGLVAAAAAGMPGTLVVAGAPRVFADEQHRPGTLYVGWGLEDGAAQSVRSSDDLADSDDGETLTVICAADSWVQVDDVALACRSVVDLLRAFDGVLRADETLGGVVHEVKLGRRSLFDWRPDPAGGVRASAAFTVEATLF